MLGDICGFGRTHGALLAGFVLVAGGLLGAGQGAAQSQTPGPRAPPSEQAGGTMIGGQPPVSTVERCVDVKIGNESAFGCINQQLRREVNRVNPSLNLPPIDARSSDVRVGNVNEAAVRQQYGSSYGRSVIPYRPAMPSYTMPRR
jgi:hypothetical protein